MQRNGKHGRLSRDISLPKTQTFSCGIFGICSPCLLSPRTPRFRVSNNGNHDLFTSDILLIQEGQSADESCESSQAVSSEPDTPNCHSLNLRGSRGNSAPIAPPLEPRLGHSGESTELSRRLRHSQELYDDQFIENLLGDIGKGQCTRSGLETLRLVTERKGRNVRALEELVGAALIDLLIMNSSNDCFKHTESYEEAFATVVRLVHNEVILKWAARPQMLGVMDWILNRGSLDARVNAAILLQKISSNRDIEKAMTDPQSVLNGIVRLSLESEQPNAPKNALRTLLALCLRFENRSGAVRAGSVAAIVKILPGASVTTAEKSLAILELIGTTPEGRAAMTDHELVVPVLVNTILKISERATEYAAGALCAICTPDTHQVQERVVRAGAQTRLLLILQSLCTPRAKRKALQLLKVMHKFWDKDPCNDSYQTERIHY